MSRSGSDSDVKDALSRTTATYDRIATHYLSRWRDRTSLLAQLHRFLAHVPRGARVLDIGCGPGFDAAILRDHGLFVTGVDLSWGMLCSGLREFPGPRIQADMRYLPVAPAIDALWVNASLLHIPRAAVPQVLDEFARVLRPAGMLHVSVKQGRGESWADNPYLAVPDGQRYFTYWSENALVAALAQAGFDIVETEEHPGSITPWLRVLARRL